MSSGEWFGLWSSRKPLEQGVIIPNFQFPDLESMPLPGKDSALKYSQFDAIVLSQSCDLSGKSVPYVHVCPIDTLGMIFDSNKLLYPTQKSRKSELDKLQEGRYTNQYISNKFTTNAYSRLVSGQSNVNDGIKKFKNERIVVNFHESVVVHTSYLKKYVKSNMRYLKLNPPYREAMAQKYGLYFMRVGNPINYAPYNDKDYS